MASWLVPDTLSSQVPPLPVEGGDYMASYGHWENGAISLHSVYQCLPDSGYQEQFLLNPGESTYQTCLAKQPAQASEFFPTLFGFLCSLLWQKSHKFFPPPNIFYIKFLLRRESIIMYNYNKWILCRWCIFLNLIIIWQWNFTCSISSWTCKFLSLEPTL